MISVGLFAHVDSGKTTLSEAILYKTGVIRTLGRVDHKTAFLDTKTIEKNRGITVYSKEARFSMDKKDYILLDTPGHIDFITEAVRTINVIDCAVLIISGVDLVEEQTKVFWKLLKENDIPTIIFVNKIDRQDFDKELIECDILDSLEGLTEDTKIIYGSALKLDGVDDLLKELANIKEKDYPKDFSFFCYKVDRDDKDNRLCHLKVTGGSLKPKDIVGDEKVQQLRAYNGEKYSLINEAKAGDIIVATGLNKVQVENRIELPVNIYTSRIILPEGIDPRLGYIKLKELSDENPDLNIYLDELRNEVHINFIGELQKEIVISEIKERFNMDVSFGEVSLLVIEPELEELEIDDRELEISQDFKLSGNDEKDLERIFNKTFGESKRDKDQLKRIKSGSTIKSKDVENFPKANWKENAGKNAPYYIIDGYNALFSFEELKPLIEYNIDAAREAFLEALQNYQGYKKVGMLVIFDGYKVSGGIEHREERGNMSVVFTKERETADRYIEKMVYEGGKIYDYTVVTSDKPVQMASFNDGARRVSSHEFYTEVINTSSEIREKLRRQGQSVNRPFEGKL